MAIHLRPNSDTADRNRLQVGARSVKPLLDSNTPSYPYQMRIASELLQSYRIQVEPVAPAATPLCVARIAGTQRKRHVIASLVRRPFIKQHVHVAADRTMPAVGVIVDADRVSPAVLDSIGGRQRPVLWPTTGRVVRLQRCAIGG